MSAIYSAIPAMLAEVDSIKKDKRNEQQGFRFRGIDDVYNAVHPVLSKHGVFILTEVLEEFREEKATRNGGVLNYCRLKVKFTFCASDGSSVYSIVSQEGSDTSDKATGKALSMAFKYALFQLLCIPTEDVMPDGDAEKHDFAPAEKPAPATKPAAKKSAAKEKAEKVKTFEDMTPEQQAFVGETTAKIGLAAWQDQLLAIGDEIKAQPEAVRNYLRELWAARNKLIRPGIFDAKTKKLLLEFQTNIADAPDSDALDSLAEMAKERGPEVFDYLKPDLNKRAEALDRLATA